MSNAPTAAELEQLWRELADNAQARLPGRQTRRVMPDSPHDCFLAVEFPTRRRVVSVAVDQHGVIGPDGRALTSGILVAQSQAPVTGRPTIDIVLRDPDHADIFTALAADLLGTLASTRTGSPGDVLLARLEEWRHLLAGVGPEGMSPQHQRGLFGELTVLEQMLLPVLGSHAVHGWTGPDRQLQDFQFPAAAIEVKTVSGSSADAVRIANERQLDDKGPGRLFLVSLALDVRQGGSGRTLPELVARLREEPGLRGAAQDFDQRLARAGYLDTQSHLYSDRRYTVRQIHLHLVETGFPRITEGDLPDGVSDVAYTVNLLAAAPFRTTQSEMTGALDQLP